MGQRAKQRFGVRTEEALNSGPDGVPGCQDQKFVIIGLLLNIWHTGNGGSDSKDPLKMRQLRVLWAGVGWTPMPVFRFGKWKAPGGNARLFEQQGIELRQLNTGSRLPRVGTDRRWNRP